MKSHSHCQLSKSATDHETDDYRPGEPMEHLQLRSVSPCALAPEEFEFVSPSLSRVWLSADSEDTESRSQCPVKIIVTPVEEICCQDSGYPARLEANCSALSGAQGCTTSKGSESQENLAGDSTGPFVTEGLESPQVMASVMDDLENPGVNIAHHTDPVVSWQGEEQSSQVCVNEGFQLDEGESRLVNTYANQTQGTAIDEEDPDTSDKNNDLREQGGPIECIDHLQNDMKDVIHLESDADANEDDRELCQKMTGFDHLSRKGVYPDDTWRGHSRLLDQQASKDGDSNEDSNVDVFVSNSESHHMTKYLHDTTVVLDVEEKSSPTACGRLEVDIGNDSINVHSEVNKDKPSRPQNIPVSGIRITSDDHQQFYGSQVDGKGYSEGDRKVCYEERDFQGSPVDFVDLITGEGKRKTSESITAAVSGHFLAPHQEVRSSDLETSEVSAEDSNGYQVRRERPFLSLEEHTRCPEVSCDSPVSERSKGSEKSVPKLRPLAFMGSNPDLSSVIEVKLGHDDSQEDVRDDLPCDRTRRNYHQMMDRHPEGGIVNLAFNFDQLHTEVAMGGDANSVGNVGNRGQLLKWCENTKFFNKAEKSQEEDDNIDDIYQEVCASDGDDGIADISLPALEEGISDQEDTNEDVRDIRAACTDVEEIDHLAKNVLDDEEPSGIDEVRDTNGDTRPVSDDLTAFDHLDGAIIAYEDKPKSAAAELRAAKRNTTDITFRVNLDRYDMQQAGAVKIAVEKSPVSGPIKKDTIIKPTAYIQAFENEVRCSYGHHKTAVDESESVDEQGVSDGQKLKFVRNHQDMYSLGYNRLTTFGQEVETERGSSNLNNCEEIPEHDSSPEDYDRISQHSSASEQSDKPSHRSSGESSESNSEHSSSQGMGGKVVAQISSASMSAQPLLCKEYKIGIDSEDEREPVTGTHVVKEEVTTEMNLDDKVDHIYTDELYTAQGSMQNGNVQEGNDDEVKNCQDEMEDKQNRTSQLPEGRQTGRELILAETGAEVSAGAREVRGSDAGLDDDRGRPLSGHELERKISIPDVSVKHTFSGGESFGASLVPMPVDDSEAVTCTEVKPDESGHIRTIRPLDIVAKGGTVSEQEAPGGVESASAITQTDEAAEQAGPSSNVASQSEPSLLRNRKLKSISMTIPTGATTSDDFGHGVVYSSSFSSGRNQTTLVSSLQVNLPSRRVDVDIAMEKSTPWTFRERKNLEQGESSNLEERGQLETAMTELHITQAVPTISGHDVIANESLGHVTFRATHLVTYNDMLTCALSFADVLFWICLAVGVIIFEFCNAGN